MSIASRTNYSGDYFSSTGRNSKGSNQDNCSAVAGGGMMKCIERDLQIRIART